MLNAAVHVTHVSEAERSVESLTRAFAGDAACRWIWPEIDQFMNAFPRFARAFGGAAYELGTAYHTDGFGGAALWLPPGIGPDDGEVSQVIEDTVSANLKSEMYEVFEQMGSYHPRETHWHLPLIGVEPSHQGRGLGSSLLRAVLHQCDESGMDSYLEATSERNVMLYSRFGFEKLGVIQVGSSPPITPMLRVARPRSDRATSAGWPRESRLSQHMG